MIELLIAIVCQFGTCTTNTIEVSTEAAAVATCESGDTKTLGTVDWDSVRENVDGTLDTGAWQFNSYWVWSGKDRWAVRPLANSIGMTSTEFLMQYPMASQAPPWVQYAMFEYLWDDGYGWWHWSASQPCWSKWMVVKKGRAVLR